MKNCISCKYMSYFCDKDKEQKIYSICPIDDLKINKINGFNWDKTKDYCSKYNPKKTEG